MGSDYPKWIVRADMVFLREVAPHLYVGAEGSPAARPEGPWSLVVSLYQTPQDVSASRDARTMLVQRPFMDGDEVPEGFLDEILPMVRDRLRVGLPVLIHCQAGLSRSASVAYAMLRVLCGLSHDEALRRVKAGYREFPVPSTLASARRWVHSVAARRSVHRQSTVRQVGPTSQPPARVSGLSRSASGWPSLTVRTERRSPRRPV